MTTEGIRGNMDPYRVTTPKTDVKERVIVGRRTEDRRLEDDGVKGRHIEGNSLRGF